MEILGRQQPLSNDNWLTLLEQRRELLRPHLETFRLPKLLHSPVFKGRGNVLDLTNLKLEIESPFDLQTPGIFGLYVADEQLLGTQHFGNRDPDREVHFWGLAQNGTWIVGQYDYALHPEQHPSLRKVIFRVVLQRAQTGQVVRCAGCEDFHARALWLALGEEARRWHEKAEQVSTNARAVVTTIDEEESLVRNLP